MANINQQKFQKFSGNNRRDTDRSWTRRSWNCAWGWWWDRPYLRTFKCRIEWAYPVWNGMEAIVLNLEEDNVGAVLLGPTEEINEGDIVKRTGRIASLGCRWRIVRQSNISFRVATRRKGPIQGELFNLPFERKLRVIFRQPVRQPLQTGIKAIDAMIPIGPRTEGADNRRPADR